MKGLLEGVMVLDLTRVLAGPYSAMMLADMGANVVKIERPGTGDDSRTFAPFVNGESAYYMNLNRNKRGMTLNLKTQEGKDIFLALVKKADIVLENYRPGTMEKLGLGYETLKEINPGIVYGAVSGFGHTGPYSKRAGYDIIGQAMGGLMSTTGWPDGPPTRTGTAMADVLGGLSVTIGILAAYIKKLKTGIGDKVDVALVDSVVSSLEIITQIYLITGVIPSRNGNRYESTYPYDSFKARDGEIIIACGNDKLFSLLTQEMGVPELSNDLRFNENYKRIENHVELKTIVESWTNTRTIESIEKQLLAAGIPVAPINTIDKVVSDPHIAGAREMFVDVNHPIAGKTTLTGSHLKFTNNKVEIEKPAPNLGQHNAEILSEFLGYTEKEVKELKKRGVL